MLRLAASALPLWRSPSALQFGEEPAIVLEPVEPWHERVVEALATGIPDGVFDTIARNAGAPSDAAGVLLEALRPILAPSHDEARPLLLAFGDEICAADRARVRSAFTVAGACLAPDGDAPAERVVVLVGSRLVEPRRAATLVADDVPHLRLELGGDRVSVGPLVVPGLTGCLACLHEYRRERDPAWPTLAAQLVARAAPPTEPRLVTEACATAMRLVSAPLAERTRSVTLPARDGEPTWYEHEPHPGCWCRSPGRSARPAAHTAPPLAPTRCSAIARPA